MLDLDGIVRRLKDRRLDHLQEGTGLSKPTISAIRDGVNTNPSHDTLKKLSDYFEEQERAPAQQ